MSVAGQPQSHLPDDDLLTAVAAVLDPDIPDQLGVAVSGGGDSVALLHVLSLLSDKMGFTLHAVTVDHGLREEAEDEAVFVAKLCARLGVPHQILRWEGWDGTGNLMAAARAARYRMIAGWAKEHAISHIALGHTADDVAENFLVRLARKAGPDGLSEMDAKFNRDGVTWLRPLLDQKRADLRLYLGRQDVSWIDDPTNEDDTYDRVRARKAVPLLADLGISAETLRSVSASMRAARQALDHYANIEARRYVVQESGDLVLRLGLTGPLPAEIKRRLWRSSIRWVSGADYPPRQDALSSLIETMAVGGSGTVGGCLITRKGDDWRVTREYQAVRDLRSETRTIWDGRWVLSGPHENDLMVRALGDAVQECPDWRQTGLPRTSLIATPAIWRGDTLIAAPVAGLRNGWTAQIVADFHQHAFAH